jgi:hypothetical protein
MARSFGGRRRRGARDGRRSRLAGCLLWVAGLLILLAVLALLLGGFQKGTKSGAARLSGAISVVQGRPGHADAAGPLIRDAQMRR